MQKYRQLRQLKISLSKSKSIPSNNKVKLKHVTNLFLYGDNKTEIDVNNILLGIIVPNNITHLTLHHFGSMESLISISTFKKILYHFNNIEYLKIKWCYIDFPQNSEFDAKSLLPKLKGFNNWTIYPKITNELIATHGNKIKIWHNYYNENIMIPANISLTNLEEVYIDEPPPTIFLSLIHI